MKRKITKLWGVGLIVVLLASLVVAVPASAAQPLQWNEEGIPSDSGDLLAEDVLIRDLAISEDGLTMYIATGNATNGVYKSTDGGNTWSQYDVEVSGTTYAVHLIAVAPDDEELVVAADTANDILFVSDDGASTWGSLDEADDGSTACTTINSIDVSAATTNNFVAVAGDDGTNGGVWTRELGGYDSWQCWDDATSTEGSATGGTMLAVKFSPNFASDEVLTAVSENGTKTGFNIFSLNSEEWNTAGNFGTKYPVALEDLGVATNADIALAPTFLGGDPVERVAFVGHDDGIHRLKDTNDDHILDDEAIVSVAYDGVTVVGGTTARVVQRCEDPLVTSPTFYGTAETKSPGGTGNVYVGFSGTTVVAGCYGDEGAFAISEDNGESFLDISLVNTEEDYIIGDIGAAAEGEVVYMTSYNGTGGTALSVWRYETTWQRVLSVQSTSADDYIVRLAPDDAEVLYIVETSGNEIYYTKDGGLGKWYSRNATSVLDLAVESSDVAYYATGHSVKKTSNGGFTWSTTAEDSKLSNNINSLTCIGEDQIVAGGTGGYVAYSTDGNDSWTKITKSAGTGNIAVTADGLGEGGNIYAGHGAGISRWTIGQASTEPWTAYNFPGATIDVAIVGGTLYGLDGGATNVIYRHTMPILPSPPPGDSITPDANTLTAWSGMAISVTDYSNKLWVIDNPTSGSDKIWSYDDTLTNTVPELIGPADGTKVSINPLNGEAYDVNFTWNSVANVDIPTTNYYGIAIMLDEAGTEAITPGPNGIQVMASATPVVSKLIGPSTSQVDANSGVTGGGAVNINYMPGTTYYWQVKVVNPIGSPTSEVRSFTIEAGAAVVPEIGSPANGGTVTETPAFSWSPVAGATMYQFEMATDTAFGAPLYAKDLAATGIQPDVDLDLGTYFWRVRVLSPTPGDWSTIANFTVGEAAPAGGAAAPVEVTVPEIEIPPITVPPAEVNIEQPTTPAEPTISEGLLWTIIIIGAVLVIAVIVLIVRTRRTV